MILLYFCTAPEGKHVSGVKNGLLVRKSLIRSFAPLVDMNRLQTARGRMMQNTSSAREGIRVDMEEFISTEGNKEKKISVSRKREEEFLRFSHYK